MSKETTKVYIGWAAKRLALVLFDIFAVNFSYWFALMARFYINFTILPTAYGYLPAFLKFAPWYTAISILVFAGFKLYTSMWKYAGLNDMNRILGACVVTAIIHVAGTLAFVKRMPITYYVFGAAIQFMMIAASRFSYRLVIAEKAKYIRGKNKAAINVMIVGIGETSRIIRQKIENDHNNAAHPVCIFAFRQTNGTNMIDGLPLLGDVNKLKNHIEKYRVDCVILADSLMTPENRKAIKKICKEINVDVQDFSSYFDNFGSAFSLRTLMERASGSVEIVIRGQKQSFDNGEAAVMAVSGRYEVKDVSAKGDKLVVELTENHIISNDTDEEWVREYEKQTGREISFF